MQGNFHAVDIIFRLNLIVLFRYDNQLLIWDDVHQIRRYAADTAVGQLFGIFNAKFFQQRHLLFCHITGADDHRSEVAAVADLVAADDVP